MSKCYVCDKDITKQTQTDEHIILNACGGRLSSKQIICSICNSEYDNAMDAELACQINYFSNSLNVKRDRGEPQVEEAKLISNGDKYYLKPGGKPLLAKPVIKEKYEEEKKEINIVARDKKELKTILKGLQRKYSQIDDSLIEELLRKAFLKRAYLNDYLKIELRAGGKLAFRSICKTAVNFYIQKGSLCI